MRKKGSKNKPKVVVDDVLINNPEEFTLEDVIPDELPPLEIIEEIPVEVPVKKLPDNIVETGVVVNGKREFKNITLGTTFIED